MKKIITLTSAIVVNCCCFGMHETENNVYNTSNRQNPCTTIKTNAFASILKPLPQEHIIILPSLLKEIKGIKEIVDNCNTAKKNWNTAKKISKNVMNICLGTTPHSNTTSSQMTVIKKNAIEHCHLDGEFYNILNIPAAELIYIPLPTLKEYQNLVLEKINKEQWVNGDIFTVLWEITKAVNLVTLPNERHDNIFDFCQKFYPKIQSYNPNCLKNVLFAMLNAYPEKDRITFITGFMQAAKGKKDLFMYKHLLQAIKCEVKWELGQIQQPQIEYQTKLLNYFKENDNYTRGDLELMNKQEYIPEYTKRLLSEFLKISDCMNSESEGTKITTFSTENESICTDKSLCNRIPDAKAPNKILNFFTPIVGFFRGDKSKETAKVQKEKNNKILNFFTPIVGFFRGDKSKETAKVQKEKNNSEIEMGILYNENESICTDKSLCDLIPDADAPNFRKCPNDKNDIPTDTIDDDSSSGDESNETSNKTTKPKETAKKTAEVQKKKNNSETKETRPLTTKIKPDVQPNKTKKNEKLITKYVNMLTNELPMSDDSRISEVITNLLCEEKSCQFYVILFAWKTRLQQLESLINQVTCREHLKLLFSNVSYALNVLPESQKKQLTEKRFSDEDLDKFSVFLKRPFETTEETTTNWKKIREGARQIFSFFWRK